MGTGGKYKSIYTGEQVDNAIRETERLSGIVDGIEELIEGIKSERQYGDEEIIEIVSNDGEKLVKVSEDAVDFKKITERGKEIAKKEDIEILDSVKEEKYNGDDGIIIESEGEVIVRINKEGLYAKKIETEGGGLVSWNILKGKNIYSLCDSLGEGSGGVLWQNVVADICGGTFHYGKSRELVSGGSQTLDLSGECGMDRARNLVNNYDNVDVVFYENVNDIYRLQNAGTSEDVPFMLENRIVHGTTFQSMTAIVENKSLIVSLYTPAVGTMIVVNYSNSNLYTVNVGSKATGSGYISFTINGVDVFSTAYISESDTLSTVVDKIISADWGQRGLTAEKTGADTISVSGTRNFSLSVNNEQTGANVTVSSSTGTSRNGLCFIGNNIQDWGDMSKWKLYTEISLWSCYKGLFEYLQRRIPKALIYFCILPDISTNLGKEQVAGAWDGYDKKSELYKIQREVCEYMWIDYADVATRGGINVYNMLSFYPENNVHPKAEGYVRLGQNIVRLLF